MSYSLAILKPDALQRGLIPKIIKILKTNGFKIILIKKLKLNERDIGNLYADCRSEIWFKPFQNFMISSESMLIIVECNTDDAVSRLNKLIGNTDPTKNSPSNIRFMGESIRRNLIHSPKDEESFWHELVYLLKKD